MAEREYEVREDFTTCQWHYVRASSKAEALEKVKGTDEHYTIQGDLSPRPMVVSNVQVVRRKSQDSGLGQES